MDFWPFGTTFHDESSQAVQCGTVYDVPALWHSSLDWGVYEYCDICILNTNFNDLYTGYCIGKNKTHYYGNKYDYLNQNYYNGPIEILVKWLTNTFD